MEEKTQTDSTPWTLARMNSCHLEHRRAGGQQVAIQKVHHLVPMLGDLFGKDGTPAAIVLSASRTGSKLEATELAEQETSL